MRLTFLGAATTVTGSQFLLTTDRAQIIIDCGLFQGSPNEAARNRIPLHYDPASIDAILLTHAHLDHCGFLPVVVREGYRKPVHATRATVELARLVLLDSGKVQVEQAKNHRERAERMERQAHRRSDAGTPPPDPEPSVPTDAEPGGLDPEETLRRQPPHLQTEIEEPLYTVEDAEAAIALFRGVDYGEAVEVAPGVTATFHDAGHILGSAIIQVDVALEDGSSRRIVFSGDVGRPNTPILRDPTHMDGGADYVLMESTYGGREHEPEEEAVRLLAEAVSAVSDHSGVLLIPAFAIGRTQEIVWQLDRLLAAGAIPHVPLYLDSPMAGRASDVYRKFPGYYDEETFRLLQEGETPLDYPDQVITNDAQQSRAIKDAPRPMMIVSASGMLTGGRIVHHLRDLIDDPGAMLLFVGYQGEGTLGAHLQAGARTVKLDGSVRQVRCEVRSISGFSAHADESELLDWLGHLSRAPRRPRRVFLVHGDPEAEEALEPKVRALGLDVHRPKWREEVELD
ncbi:MAG: metallo-beta-lactamase family protein [Chloroflexota bacterium]|nr:metallo-beta-lactamase family protein [Chloroflexota bacterium]